jgi:hypothetical protein
MAPGGTHRNHCVALKSRRHIRPLWVQGMVLPTTYSLPHWAQYAVFLVATAPPYRHPYLLQTLAWLAAAFRGTQVPLPPGTPVAPPPF